MAASSGISMVEKGAGDSLCHRLASSAAVARLVACRSAIERRQPEEILLVGHDPGEG